LFDMDFPPEFLIRGSIGMGAEHKVEPNRHSASGKATLPRDVAYI